MIISGVISNDGGGGVTYQRGSTQATNTVLVTGANTYTGATTINTSATVIVNAVGNSGAASALGENASIIMGAGNRNGTLAYTGSGETTNKVITIGAVTTAGTGAIIDTTGATGGLIFTQNLAYSGTSTASTKLTLQGDSTGNQFNGASQHSRCGIAQNGCCLCHF